MGGLFGGKQKAQVQKPTPVVPIADEQDPAVLRARQQSILAAQQRGGRQSTILSSGGDALGSTPGGAA